MRRLVVGGGTSRRVELLVPRCLSLVATRELLARIGPAKYASIVVTHQRRLCSPLPRLHGGTTNAALTRFGVAFGAMRSGRRGRGSVPGSPPPPTRGPQAFGRSPLADPGGPFGTPPHHRTAAGDSGPSDRPSAHWRLRVIAARTQAQRRCKAWLRPCPQNIARTHSFQRAHAADRARVVHLSDRTPWHNVRAVRARTCGACVTVPSSSRHPRGQSHQRLCTRRSAGSRRRRTPGWAALR